MILASAQTKPKRGNIESNLNDHYNLIDLASQNQADLIVFPEMSITGYERENALDLAFTENDSRLDVLRQLSADKQMILITGAPILISNNLYIGAFIIKPDCSISIYTKQYLHSGEEKFFKSSSGHNPKIRLCNEQISIAICSDIDNSPHAENTAKAGSTIYIASLFFTPGGIPNAYKTLSGYAKQFGLNVLMSNYCGQLWGLDAGGQSGFWDKNGKLIANLNDADSGLLIIENIDNTWTGKSVKYE
ncbi:MAG: carbon-nitrogen hydrolase family protein [Tannerella sp.]|jgi:predicted amidohydrolase|nr:carbon-nitrogen hydrolase family protein [Tannerella sp.]